MNCISALGKWKQVKHYTPHGAGYALVRANGKCKQSSEGWKSDVERCELRFLARARFRLKLDIIYLGSQSASASLVIFPLVRLYAECEDKV